MAVLTVLPDDVRVRVRRGQTIVAALSAAGLAYRVGCRQGSCGTCQAVLATGSVSYRSEVADRVLTAEERARGVVLTCQAIPEGDVTVLLPEGHLRVTNRLLTALRAARRSAGG